jgi:murein DD-endopeptidase MepM/ murein hydrolase activator NlpD
MQASRRLAVAVSVALAGSAIAGSTAIAGGGGMGAPAPGEPTPADDPVAGTGGGVTPGFGHGRYRFPLAVPHSYGDGFGAGRGHEGQDVFAACGSPVLAARGGRIQRVGHHPRAGNYVVVDGQGTRVDTMYAHLLRRPPLRRRAAVATGEQIGQVGSSGNASGCHLHFEIWTAPGWYEGGFPMPAVGRLLRDWDAWS